MDERRCQSTRPDGQECGKPAVRQLGARVYCALCCAVIAPVVIRKREVKHAATG